MIQSPIKTTMTGKEYLAYRKYRDERNNKMNAQLGVHLDKFKWHYIGVVLIVFLIGLLYELLTYTEPVKHTLEGNIFWLAGFLVVCLGLSWLIHGVGFVLVKR